MIVATTAAHPGGPECIEIIGTNGTTSLIGGTLRVALLNGHKETFEAEGFTGSGINIMDFPIDVDRDLLADLFDALATERDPSVTGEEALASQQLVSDILERAAA